MGATDFYASEADFRASLHPQIFLQCFDDDQTGVVSTDAAPLLLTRQLAHAWVTSWLRNAYVTMPSPLPATVPYLLKMAELQACKALAFERHPEFGKTYTKEYMDGVWKRAEDLMQNIADAVQEIAPDDAPPEPSPRTSGGIVTNTAPRVFIDSADGTSNSGDL